MFEAGLKLMIILPQPLKWWDYSMNHHTGFSKNALNRLMPQVSTFVDIALSGE
jgi:hypothetical protein